MKVPKTLSPDKIQQLYDMEKLQQARDITPIISPAPIKLISIITPVYNTKAEYLQDAYNSVIRQTYANWEWCICNDGSTDKETIRVLNEIKLHPQIHITHAGINAGIASATTTAAKQAKGDIITFLDHDDMLHTDALTEIMNMFKMHDADVVYTDEAIWRMDKETSQIHAKPNFSPHYLWSTNYICHLLAVKKSVYDSIGGMRSGFDGSQDHDLVLRLANATKKIYHIPKCLYYWRMHPESFSKTAQLQTAVTNGIAAIHEDFERRHITGTINSISNESHYSAKIDVKGSPAVQIIIPTFSLSKTLLDCLNAIFKTTSYKNYKINLVTNVINATAERLNELPLAFRGKINLISEYTLPFQMSHVLNTAVKMSESKYIVVMHDDTIIQSTNWLEWFVGYLQDDTVGAVSGKICNKLNYISEFGGVVGLNTLVSSMFKGLPAGAPSDFGRAQAIQNTSTVFNTLMAFSKEKFEKINGFDEKYTLWNSDIDFCLRLKEQGYFNVILPACQAMHLESERRLIYQNKNNNILHTDRLTFTSKYNHLINKGDPYYNPILLEQQDKIKNNTIKITSIIKEILPQTAPAQTVYTPPVYKPKVTGKFLSYRWENPNVLVSYIIPWYEQIPIAVFSLLLQTYPNIELILYHDGPLSNVANNYANSLNDKRIKLFNSPKRYNDFGNTPRNLAIDKISDKSAAVVITGADNYYLPTFTIEMFSILCQEADASAVFCDMLHNDKNWNTIITDLRYAYIDCGCFMTRPEIAREFRWESNVSWEDWIFIEKVISKYNIESIRKLPRMLYIHN